MARTVGRELRNSGQRGQDRTRGTWSKQACGCAGDQQRSDVRGALVGVKCAQVGEWLHQWPKYLGGMGSESQARGP